MAEDSCPACGALPCDWCWNPRTDKDSEVVSLRAQIAALQAKVDALETERNALFDECVSRRSYAEELEAKVDAMAEPTPEMLEAGFMARKAFGPAEIIEGFEADIYRAMIAAR